MDNDVGIADRLDAAKAEQSGITTPDIDNLHLCGLTIARRHDQSGKLPISSVFITTDDVICRRAIDYAVLDSAPPRRRQHPQVGAPRFKITGNPAKAGRQHALDTGPDPLAEDRCRACR
jgi:hypothetical protein